MDKLTLNDKLYQKIVHSNDHSSIASSIQHKQQLSILSNSYETIQSNSPICKSCKCLPTSSQFIQNNENKIRVQIQPYKNINNIVQCDRCKDSRQRVCEKCLKDIQINFDSSLSLSDCNDFNKETGQLTNSIQTKLINMKKDIQRNLIMLKGSRQFLRTCKYQQHLSIFDKFIQTYQQNLIHKQYQYLQENKQSLYIKNGQLSNYTQDYQSLLTILQKCPKTILLTHNSSQIQKQIHQKIEQIDSFIVPKFTNKYHHSHLKPLPQGISYRVQNFQEMNIMKKQIITNKFNACNGQWILKVYPAGYIQDNSKIKNQQVQYLSIYLQMLRSLHQKQKYKISIEIYNINGSANRITKQFSAQYTQNDSWGYDRYIRIPNLYRKNLISSDNSLCISVWIALQNYEDIINPLRKQITMKQKQYLQNKQKIQKMRKLIKQRQQQKIVNRKQQQKIVNRKQQQKIVNRKQQQKILKDLRPLKCTIDKKQAIKYGKNASHSHKNAQISLQSPSSSKILRLFSSQNSKLIQKHQKIVIHNRGIPSY